MQSKNETHNNSNLNSIWHSSEKSAKNQAIFEIPSKRRLLFHNLTQFWTWQISVKNKSSPF